MPIKIQDGLPAIQVLNKENIFVISESRASQQDIRPLKILILNLMPHKIVTESQLLRMLANSPLQCDVELIRTRTYQSRHTPHTHLESFYKTFQEIEDRKFDGFIITGAPVETLDFEEVEYWPEMVEIMDWAAEHVFSSMFICWASQASLYHRYGIPKYKVNEKVFGIFEHRVNDRCVPLVRGFDDVFFAPQSRHTEVRREDIEAQEDLVILAESAASGVYMVSSRNGRQIYVSGHAEYDPMSLYEEYVRDVEKGKNPPLPQNYFPGDDPARPPVTLWRSHAHLLFSNWLNYYVYQETPYNF